MFHAKLMCNIWDTMTFEGMLFYDFYTFFNILYYELFRIFFKLLYINVFLSHNILSVYNYLTCRHYTMIFSHIVEQL